jgi:hypothetical protein
MSDVRRKKPEPSGERGRRTLIPAFEPPGHSSAYARIVEEGSLEPKSGRLLEESGFEPVDPADSEALDATVDAVADIDLETVGREMYGSYLASDFPAALILAERVLAKEPSHAFAQLVASQCRERLGSRPVSQTLRPSSVLRLKFAELERQSRHLDARTSFVLGHIDGVSDAATVAALTGLPSNEALNRLHALLDLGVLEVVSF